MPERREIERWIGAVLVPEVRVAGTIASREAILPSLEYVRRFPPAGVVVFGRTPQGARSPSALLAELRSRCADVGAPRPFACCDLEQGAGLHFPSATRLPPALALASAASNDPRGEERGLAWIRSAGALTAREARELEVELVLAPVADVGTRSGNPIIAVRSFGAEPSAVGARAGAFFEGLHAGGAGGCAKHFPGHGDTAQDSHLELPRVDHDAARLHEVELAPFRALIAAGVDSIMVAHLDVPALAERPGVPATLSPRIVDGLLRTELGFDGAVLTDAMNMGALAHENERYVRALQAGCDALLCPHDPHAAAHELLAAVESGRLEASTLRRAAERVHALRERLSKRAALGEPRDLHRGALARANSSARAELARELASRALLAPANGWAWPLGDEFELDLPHPTPDSPEIAELFARARGGSHAVRANVALPIVCQVAAWKGSYGLEGEELRALELRIAQHRAAGKRVGLLWFASPEVLPRSLRDRPDLSVLVAFAPTAPMVDAALDFLRSEHPGSQLAREG